MLSETSQTEKDILYDPTYMWNLKNEQTDRKRGQMWDYQRWRRVEGDWRKVVKRHKLPVIR